MEGKRKDVAEGNGGNLGALQWTPFQKFNLLGKSHPILISLWRCIKKHSMYSVKF